MWVPGVGITSHHDEDESPETLGTITIGLRDTSCVMKERVLLHFLPVNR